MPNPTFHLLASAQATDIYGTQAIYVLIGFAAAAGTGLLAIVPAAIAKSHGHPQRQTILVLAVLWALASAASLAYAVISRMQWSQEWMLLVQTGYYDPQDLSGQPAWPWAIWIGLALAYGAICLWSRRGQSAANHH